MITAEHVDAASAALLRASWQASVLVGVLLVVQWAVGARLPARWRYNLWLLVLLRLCLPVVPASSWSLFNWVGFNDSEVTAGAAEGTARGVEGMGASASLFTPVTIDAPEPHGRPAPRALGEFPGAGSVSSEAVLVSPSNSDTHADDVAGPGARVGSGGFRWTRGLLLLWVIGAVFFLARGVVASVRVERRVRGLSKVTDADTLALLRRCCGELGLRRRVLLLRAPVGVPAVVGWLRPRLLLPEGLLGEGSTRELRLILLHELAHVRRHDVLVNYLAAVLRALHWFNPVLHVAFARLRVERELACDERVLSLAQGPEDHRAYGYALIRLLEQTARRNVSPGVIGILEGPHQMRRRITMIATFRPRNRWALPAAGLSLALGAALLTDRVGAQSARPTREATDPALAPGAAPAALPPTPDAKTGTRPSADPSGMGFAAEPVTPVGAPLNPTAPAADAPGAEGNPFAAPPRRGKTPAAVNAARATDPVAGLPAPAQVRTVTRRVSRVSVDTEADAEAIRQKLARRVPEARFDAVSFNDFVAFLRDVTDMNIVVNWRVLEAAGIERDATVTLSLKNVTADQVLRMAARELGGGDVRVGHAIEHGILVISTADDLSANTQVEVYDVSDLLRVGQGGLEELRQQLLTTIRSSVAADSWVDQGGSLGNIAVFGQKLSITQTAENHEAIRALLEKLRQGPEPSF